MLSPEETPVNPKTNGAPPDLDDSFVETCSSTGCDFHRDLLCAPRPRARTRINESDFFEADNKEVTSVSDRSSTQGSPSCGDEKVEDWACASTYSSEILNYLVKMEEKYRLPHDFLADQPEVTTQARAVLVDWIIQVGLQYQISQNVKDLAINSWSPKYAAERNKEKWNSTQCWYLTFFACSSL